MLIVYVKYVNSLCSNHYTIILLLKLKFLQNEEIPFLIKISFY